eukprot:5102387-Amphidinium_carterae.1
MRTCPCVSGFAGNSCPQHRNAIAIRHGWAGQRVYMTEHGRVSKLWAVFCWQVDDACTVRALFIAVMGIDRSC